ncbi:MAG: DUF1775 domain-containing protein [Gammaproteobacteria bacterium]
MKIKQTCLVISAATAFLAPQFVSAHSTIVEKEITEGTATYLTIQVPHGCGDLPTKKIDINMAGPQDDDPADWKFTHVQPVLSWYQIKTTADEVTDEVDSIHISGISLPSHYVLKAEFRGKAPLLHEGVDSKKLYFDIVQHCTNNSLAEWTVANGKAASVLVTKAPAGDSGHSH